MNGDPKPPPPKSALWTINVLKREHVTMDIYATDEADAFAKGKAMNGVIQVVSAYPKFDSPADE